MNNIKTSDLMSKLDECRTNPNAIQQSVYDLLEQASDGRLNLVDPTNPFCLLLEAAAVVSADALAQTETITRRQYPLLTTNESDLYGHISDFEYVGIFGAPSSDDFLFLMNLDEIKARARQVAGQTFSKLTIPRETKATVNGTEFGFCYPIDLRVSSTGTLSIFYDTSVTSPFMNLDSNIIDYDVVSFGGRNYVRFMVKGLQYKLKTYQTAVSTTTGFSTDIQVEDSLYQCRVYQKLADGSYSELHTTFSGRVYDPEVVTASLKYADGNLTVKIPSIYLKKGMVSNSLRIDVFSTKGDIALAVGEFTSKAITVRWDDYTPVENGRYSAVLSELSEISITGTGTTSGGSNGLTFAQLRDRVVTNSTSKPVPVTQLDLTNDLSDSGYGVVPLIDNVTDLKYLATRPLPMPLNTLSSSVIGALFETVRIEPTVIEFISTVKHNGLVTSIMPETLYKRNGTSIAFVSDLERQTLADATVDELAALMAETEYFYTPYLTVLNARNNLFEYNSYHIDAPKVVDKFFQAENSKVDYEASISKLYVERSALGYTVTAHVKGEGGHETLNHNQIGIQLAFTPDSSLQRVYANGICHGRDKEGHMVYKFNMETNFEVREGHKLLLTNFEMINNDTLTYPVSPDTKYDFIHYVTNAGLTNEKRDTLHSLLGSFMAPSDAVVIAHETATLNVFQSLEGIASRSRSSVGEPVYDTWEVDVPWLYEEDVYETGEDGFMELYLDEETGKYDGKLLHAKGSPVLDANDQPRIKYPQGSYKLDALGNKVQLEDGGVVRFVDLLLFDARYRYTTEPTTVEYRDNVFSTIVEWIAQDINSLKKVLLPRTSVRFAPTVTMGEVTVYSTAGEPIRLNAGLGLRVDLYMTHNGYSNSALRQSILKDIRSIVVAELNKVEVSTGSIHEAIRAVTSDEVVSIKVHSFKDTNLDAFTLQDSTATCSLAKTFEQQPDGSLALVDDLDVSFIKHK